MALLDRFAFLRPRERQFELVPIPELATPEDPSPCVRVRAMSALDRAEYEMALQDSAGKVRSESLRDARQLLAVFCCVDEAGERLFTREDVELLGRQDWQILNRVAEAALRLNRLTSAEVDVLAKNSVGTPAVDPPSA
jgi:hypothetical protein